MKYKNIVHKRFVDALRLLEHKGIILKKKDLAEKLKCSPNVISEILGNRMSPTSTILVNLFENYDVRPDYIFLGMEPILRQDESETDSQIKILPVQVDNQGNENIAFVSEQARAGYLVGYSDQEYVGKLPSYRLPNFNNGSFRMFSVVGNSMYPTLHPGDIVVGQYIESFDYIRDGRVYVVVTNDEGIVVKRVLDRISENGKLILKSDNQDGDYPHIIVTPKDVAELWYVKGYISRQLPEPDETRKMYYDLDGRLAILEKTIEKLTKNF